MSCNYISIFSVLTFGQGQISWRGERWGLPHPSWYRPRGTHWGAHHHCNLQRDTCRRYTWVDYQRLPSMWHVHHIHVSFTRELITTAPLAWHVQKEHFSSKHGPFTNAPFHVTRAAGTRGPYRRLLYGMCSRYCLCGPHGSLSPPPLPI